MRSCLKNQKSKFFFIEFSQSHHLNDVDVAGHAIKQLKTKATRHVSGRTSGLKFKVVVASCMATCLPFKVAMNLKIANILLFFHGKFHGTFADFMASFVATYLSFFKIMATWQLSWQVELAICYDATIATWQVWHGKSDLPRPFAICHIAPWQVSMASF